MKNTYAACLFLGALLCSATPAAACRLMERPSVESLQNAPVALIGTVIEAGENGRVGMTQSGRLTFAVQKAIRGVPAGAQTYSIDIAGATSCDSEFNLGERWLYLGYHIKDNSLKLETQEGRSVAENIAFVQEQTGAVEAVQSLAHKGTFKPICKEGKESGFEIALENGSRAEVFSTAADVLSGRIMNLEKEISDPAALTVYKALQSYRGEPMREYLVPLDRQQNDWSGRLDMCLQGEACTPVDGARLQLGKMSENIVTGKIIWYRNPPLDHAYVFRVTRQEKDNCE